MQEQIVETKICKQCGVNFEITDKDLEFYDKISPIFAGKKYSIPNPSLCPECRQQRRLSFRNERKLYKRKCDLTGVDIISLYSPDKSYTVYENKVWWSDKWNELDYAVDFNFEKLFFEQFEQLFKKVPRINLYIQNEENSPYSNYESDMKNCYLTIGGHWNDNCMYGNYYISSKDSVDNYWLFNSNHAYECINSYNVYNGFFLQYANDCQNCYFGFDLKNCSDCIGCLGLRNKKYCILNKQYTKEEYDIEFKKLDLSNYSNLQKVKEKFYELYIKTPHIYVNIINSENSTGNDIFNSKNCVSCFGAEDAEDSRYGVIFGFGKDCMDVYSMGKMEKVYECSSGGMDSYNILFSELFYGSQNLIYCNNCHYSNNCFGCVGLKNKQYCILNKQYTKEEYEKLVSKIIEHMKKTYEWGEFFPASISPFGYNETVAMEYFPIEKPPLTPPCQGGEQDNSIPPLTKGSLGEVFNWSDYEAPFPKVEKIISANKLPDSIADIPDDILNRAIECEVTKKPFRIIKQELEFYRKHNLPIPKRHPDQRHLDRIDKLNPKKIFFIKCNKCGIEIKTTYSPDREEIVYCEKCYNKVIY